MWYHAQLISQELDSPYKIQIFIYADITITIGSTILTEATLKTNLKSILYYIFFYAKQVTQRNVEEAA